MSTIIPIKQELGLSTSRGLLTSAEANRPGFVTNYPNVAQWREFSAADMYQPEPLNIYVHIPFCAQQCSYCYYRVVTGASKSDLDRYTDAICKEMELSAKHNRLHERPIRSIYFGGGTPTMLQRVHLQQIAQCIKDTFANIQGAEFSIEAEPVSMTQKAADSMADLPVPVTRISMGVQSLDDNVIKHTQRKDTAAKVIRAINIAQSLNVTVNIDLMSGLAGDTLPTWQNSVQKALATGVESITVYKTEVFANTQYYRDLRKDAIRLPNNTEEMEYMEYALDAFDKADYKPWSFFAFTKNGAHTHVHTPSVWSGQDNLPLGASAFGKIGDYLFQNTNDPEKYMQTIESGDLAFSRGQKLSCKDKMVRAAVLGMKVMRLDLDLFATNFGYRLEKLCAPMIAELLDNDFISLTKTTTDSAPSELKMTRKGLLHADYVGKQLGQALQAIDI